MFRGLDENSDDMSRATDLFAGPDADAKVQEVKQWLKSQGVYDLDPVSLFCDQLDKARPSACCYSRVCSNVASRKHVPRYSGWQTVSPSPSHCRQ